MRTCIHASLGILVLDLLASFAGAQVNPDYTSWAQFELGTSVTSKQISKFSGQTSEVTLIRTLVEKTTDMVVVEMKMQTSMAGAPELPPSRITIKAKMEPQRGRGARASNEAVKESEESITVAGKSYQAKVTETTVTGPSQLMITKTWTSPQFPGLTMKSSQRMEGPVATETLSEVTAVTIKLK